MLFMLIDTLSRLLHFLMKRGSFQGCSTCVLSPGIVWGCVRHARSPWILVLAVALLREVLQAWADERALIELMTSPWPHTYLRCCLVTITAFVSQESVQLQPACLPSQLFRKDCQCLKRYPAEYVGGISSFHQCLWETSQEPLSFPWRSEVLLSLIVFLYWGMRAPCVHVCFNSFGHEFVSFPHVAAMWLLVGNYCFWCYLRSYRPG